MVAKDAPIVAAAATGADYLAACDQKDLLCRRDEIFAAFHCLPATPEEILPQTPRFTLDKGGAVLPSPAHPDIHEETENSQSAEQPGQPGHMGIHIRAGRWHADHNIHTGAEEKHAEQEQDAET